MIEYILYDSATKAVGFRFFKRLFVSMTLCAVCAAFTPIAQAQYACAAELGNTPVDRPYDNPCPAPDDLVLPMPNDLVMAFRRVDVPGEGFWSDPARNVELGDPDARIFEGPRLVTVSGSFKQAQSENWQILIAKYELSVAQYAAIVGEGSLRTGLELLARDSVLRDVYTRALQEGADPIQVRRLLSSPVRGLRAGALEDAARRYTDWCYSSAECLDAIPAFGSMPGFIRLPTEIEWEYAARRSSSLDERISLLPFDPADSTRHAYVSTGTRERSGPTPIGRLAPTDHGIHDLYGNVSELVDGRFYAELGQGKPGMYVSRGDSYAYSLTRGPLRPSRREEVQDYRRNDDGSIGTLRSVRLGTRFAIGSQTVPDLDTLEALEVSYAHYRSNDRLDSASGQSTRADSIIATDPLDAIDRLIETYKANNALPTAFSEELTRLTDRAKSNLQRATESIAYELVKRLASLGAEIGRNDFRARHARSRATIFAGDVAERMIKQAENYELQQRLKLSEYSDAIFSLAGYREYAETAVADYASRIEDPLLSASMDLAAEHLSEILNGNQDTEIWLQQFAERFTDDSLFR